MLKVKNNSQSTFNQNGHQTHILLERLVQMWSEALKPDYANK